MSYQLGYIIDTDTFMGIVRNCDALKNISQERIRDELNKILVLNNPDKSIHDLYQSGLLKHIIPELINCVAVQQNSYHKDDVYYHTLEVLKNTKPILKQRLMALFHDIGKPIAKTEIDNKISFLKHEDISADLAEKIMIRLKYSTDEMNSVVYGVENHMRFKSAGLLGENISDKALRKFKFGIPLEDIEDVLDLMHADNISHAPHVCMPQQISCIRERIKKLNIIISKPKLPINGDDLIKIFNLKPSKIFGEILKVIEEEYYENPELTLEEALEIVRNML
jgi:tRNA nucleotidyltransferase (CCA-adding enzyme)